MKQVRARNPSKRQGQKNKKRVKITIILLFKRGYLGKGRKIQVSDDRLFIDRKLLTLIIAIQTFHNFNGIQFESSLSLRTIGNYFFFARRYLESQKLYRDESKSVLKGEDSNFCRSKVRNFEVAAVQSFLNFNRIQFRSSLSFERLEIILFLLLRTISLGNRDIRINKKRSALPMIFH